MDRVKGESKMNNNQIISFGISLIKMAANYFLIY